MRFLRETDAYRCGPIALINLAKWQGRRPTRADLPRFERACRFRPPHLFRQPGTWDCGITRAVSRRPRRVSYGRFKRIINGGGAAIVSINEWTKDTGHIFLVSGRQGNQFTAVNPYMHETVSLLSYQNLYAILQRSMVWTFRS